MEVVRRFRDHQHRHEKPDADQYLTKVRYSDGRFTWVEPHDDAEEVA